MALDGIINHPFTQVETWEEFQSQRNEWEHKNPVLATDSYTDKKTNELALAVAEIINQKYPTQKGSKLFQKHRFFTDDIQEMVQPQYAAIQKLVSTGTPDQEIIAALVVYVEKILF